jgi:cephalosporin hydroxylase
MENLNLNIETVYPGAEMLPFERLKLYSWITEIIKPKNDILETGCGTGGSTYYISESVKHINSKSVIYTCDPDRKPNDNFLNNHPNVRYSASYSADLILEIINNIVKIDYIFFDGPEDPNVAMEDIKVLEGYIQPGCYFSMHDWEFERRKYDMEISTKAEKIRPYIENSSLWKPIEVLEGIESNESVGFCLYEFLGK